MLRAEQSPLVYLILIMMSSIIILWTKKIWPRKVQGFGQGCAANQKHSQNEDSGVRERSCDFASDLCHGGAQASEKRGQTQEKPQRTKENLHIKIIQQHPFVIENTPLVTTHQ